MGTNYINQYEMPPNPLLFGACSHLQFDQVVVLLSYCAAPAASGDFDYQPRLVYMTVRYSPIYANARPYDSSSESIFGNISRYTRIFLCKKWKSLLL